MQGLLSPRTKSEKHPQNLKFNFKGIGMFDEFTLQQIFLINPFFFFKSFDIIRGYNFKIYKHATRSY
jgi:hypothetical protein